MRGVGVLVLLASTAAADPDPPAATTTREWYGGWVVAADAIAMTSTLAIAEVAHAGERHRDLALAAAYLLPAPIVHLLHCNRRGALTSAIARIALPITGGITASGLAGLFALGRSGGNVGAYLGTGTDAFVAGAAIGAVTAYVLDWTMLPVVTRNTVGVAVSF